MSTLRSAELTLFSRAHAYVELTKPDVSFLVVMTTAAGYYMGTRGPVAWLHMLHAVFGTTLIAAGTAALNHYLERETDRTMRRTAARPLPSGVLQPREALAFGVVLSIAGAADLFVASGALACGLGVATCLSYLLAYTPLKKRTVWATFVGAFPGAIPPMIGWVAATGSLDRGAWLLFAILFFWQFPHFHAISWMYREDYARAGICRPGRRAVFFRRSRHQLGLGAGLPVGCQRQDECSRQVADARHRSAHSHSVGTHDLRQDSALAAPLGRKETPQSELQAKLFPGRTPGAPYFLHSKFRLNLGSFVRCHSR